MSSKRIIDLRKRPETRSVRPRALSSVRIIKEKRSSPLRARRRRNKFLVGGLVALVIVGLVYGVHWLSYLPQFSVQTVELRGEKNMPEEIVRTYAESQLFDGTYRFLSRSNIFLYPRRGIESGIVASFPRIQLSRVFRESLLSQTVVVEVVERQPFAQWCGLDAMCYQMDDSGYIFAEASTTSRSMYREPYIFAGGIVEEPIGKTYIPGHLPGMLSLLRALQQRGHFTPVSVLIDAEQDFSVEFEQSFLLKASFGQNADLLAKNLELVLSSAALSDKLNDIEYIDLRFGNRVYYKLKGGEQVEQ